MTTDTQPQVTQADMADAADYLDSCGWDWGACEDIRTGRVDHPVVKAFACHRQHYDSALRRIVDECDGAILHSGPLTGLASKLERIARAALDGRSEG